MGPLRSALAAARRQRRRRGVFVSLYRPCCGAAAAIARRRRGPADPPPPQPPARPPSWRRARPSAAVAAAAAEARAPATPFSFLCLCPRGRLLARLIARPRPALCPPPLPRRVAAAERRSLRPGSRARLALGSRPTAAARAARFPCSMGVGPWPTPLRLPLLQPARSPEPTRPLCERTPAAWLLRGRSQSARRRRWSPSPPSGAGGAAAAASRGTPELPRAPSARLAELLAPRRCLSGRGDARSPPPPARLRPQTRGRALRWT